MNIEHSFTKETDCSALSAVKAIIENRGTSPRLYRNALVFLAPDKARLDELSDSTRLYLAWKSIVDERVALDLSPYQHSQAEAQLGNADSVVRARLPETYQWLLVPTQNSPQEAISWQPYRLTGGESLAARASKKLRNEGGLVPKLAGTQLRYELDRIPLWRGDHVAIKELCENFFRYPYLPRLRDPAVLLAAIRDGLTLLSWDRESFAFADSYNETEKRYVGLRCGQDVAISGDSFLELLVKPEAAVKQQAVEQAARAPGSGGAASPMPGGAQTPYAPGQGAGPAPADQPKLARRFFGTVKIDAARMNRDASKISDEVVQHLVSLLTSDVEVTLEIQASIPEGVPENVVRTVTENCRTLKFESHGFEKE